MCIINNLNLFLMEETLKSTTWVRATKALWTMYGVGIIAWYIWAYYFSFEGNTYVRITAPATVVMLIVAFAILKLRDHKSGMLLFVLNGIVLCSAILLLTRFYQLPEYVRDWYYNQAIYSIVPLLLTLMIQWFILPKTMRQKIKKSLSNWWNDHKGLSS